MDLSKEKIATMSLDARSKSKEKGFSRKTRRKFKSVTSQLEKILRNMEFDRSLAGVGAERQLDFCKRMLRRQPNRVHTPYSSVSYRFRSVWD